MRVGAFANQKGGSGKTTPAVHTWAACAEQQGQTMVRASAMDWVAVQ